MTVKVLVMDDKEQYADLIVEVADLEGIEAVSIQNPLLFEDELKKYKSIELIYLDLNMPERDGIEILRSLATMKFEGYIVLISGYDESVLATARKLTQEYNLCLLSALAKPLSIQTISDTLNQLNSGDAFKNLPVNYKKKPTGQLDKDFIEKALDENSVEMHYQPKVSLTTYDVVGLEALVRLKDETGKIIPPSQFIESVERFRLNEKLLNRVIEQVCVDHASHLHLLGTLTISINVSALDLDHLDFPDRLARTIKASSLSPGDLIIEVTESRAIEQLNTGLDILARLRLKGFHLSIDDFGTGSAVLENVKNLPYTELKIDKSFVKQLFWDEQTRFLTKDLIDMGHHVHLRIVAEGVEDIETAVLLKGMGCDIAQGFYFAKPMAAQSLVTTLKKQNESVARSTEDQDLHHTKIKPMDEEDKRAQKFIDVLLHEHRVIKSGGKNQDIGMVVPLTGDLAALGRSYFLGANMAFKKYLADHGLSHKNFSLTVYDDHSSSKRFFQLLENKVSNSFNAFLGGIIPVSKMSNLIEVTKEKELAFFAPFSGCPSLRDKNHNHIFNFKNSYASETNALLKIADSKGGKVCLVSVKTSMGLKIQEHVEHYFPEVEIILTQGQVNSNIKTIIDSLKNMDARNIVVFGPQKLFLLLMLKYREIKPKAIFYSSSLIPVAAMHGMLTTNFSNVFIATPVPSKTDDLPVVNEFKECLHNFHIPNSKRLINSIVLEGYISMKITFSLLHGIDSEKALLSELNKKIPNASPMDLGLEHPLFWKEEKRELSPPVIHIVEYSNGQWLKKLVPVP